MFVIECLVRCMVSSIVNMCLFVLLNVIYVVCLVTYVILVVTYVIIVVNVLYVIYVICIQLLGMFSVPDAVICVHCSKCFYERFMYCTDFIQESINPRRGRHVLV